MPNALAIGVDYELFWVLNPKSLSPFVKAFNLKQKQDDFMAWQYGKYVKMAIVSSLDKNTKYPTKPFLDSVGVDPYEDMKKRILDRVEVLNSRFDKGE